MNYEGYFKIRYKFIFLLNVTNWIFPTIMDYIYINQNENERCFQQLRNDHENMSFVQIPIQV